jgi:hypothetical protein
MIYFFYLLLWSYGSCLNPLKWVLVEYCCLFSFILYLIHVFLKKIFKRIHVSDCLRKWCIDVSIFAGYRYTYQWYHRRGRAPLSATPSRQGIQEAKANSKHSMILATRWWLLIYCSPLIQFHNKTLTERKLISNWKGTNLKDPNKLRRKYLDPRHDDLGWWDLRARGEEGKEREEGWGQGHFPPPPQKKENE